MGHQASVVESLNCDGEGGNNGCEGLTRKGDKVNGVIRNGGKLGREGRRNVSQSGCMRRGKCCGSVLSGVVGRRWEGISGS